MTNQDDEGLLPNPTSIAIINEFSQCVDRLSSLTVAIIELVAETYPKLEQAVDPDEKTVLSEKLASGLSPIVDRYSIQGTNFHRIAIEVDGSLQEQLNHLATVPREDWDHNVRKFLTAAGGIAKSSAGHADAAQKLSDFTNKLMSNSPALDACLQLLRTANYAISNRRVLFLNWLELLKKFSLGSLRAYCSTGLTCIHWRLHGNPAR
jgi:hypothetical protein